MNHKAYDGLFMYIYYFHKAVSCVMKLQCIIRLQSFHDSILHTPYVDSIGTCISTWRKPSCM